MVEFMYKVESLAFVPLDLRVLQFSVVLPH